MTAEKNWKQIMIDVIRSHQYYEEGSLERLTEEEVREIYENLIDWLG